VGLLSLLDLIVRRPAQSEPSRAATGMDADRRVGPELDCDPQGRWPPEVIRTSDRCLRRSRPLYSLGQPVAVDSRLGNHARRHAVPNVVDVGA